MGSNACQKCCGIMSLVTGALLLLNAYVWPKWLGIDGWVTFIAVLLVLGGFIKLAVPNKCPGCAKIARISPITNTPF